jgi:ABC-type sugar transport system substrate-binding protein
MGDYSMKTVLKSAVLGLAASACLTGSVYAADIRVAFVPQIQGIPYYVAMEEGAKAAAKKFGVEYVQQGPTSTNSADQLRIFDSFVNQRFNVNSASSTASSIKALTSSQYHPSMSKR